MEYLRNFPYILGICIEKKAGSVSPLKSLVELNNQVGEITLTDSCARMEPEREEALGVLILSSPPL